jgi:transcriptional regulator with XRE-family HTH domain
MLNDMQLYGPLDNYISMHRMQAGLSQDELAIMLGLEGRGSVARYELALRLPELQTLLALELIFDEPLQKLFAGVAQKVRADIPRRARALLEGAAEQQTSAGTAQKQALLARLAHLDEEEFTPWESAA